MAFDFPPAQDGLRVTNPESGVTYVYREKYQSWIIEGVDNKQTRVHICCCTPCNAQQGDLWFDNCNNCLAVYHEGVWEPVVDCSSAKECLSFKGEKDRISELPATGNEIGDLWIVLEDNSLYVWSTHGWLPADRYNDEAIWEGLKQEEQARIAVDVELNKLIERVRTDSQIEDHKLWDALKEEEQDRLAGDAALEQQLTECCNKAQEELERLEGELQQEIKDREFGDEVQQGLIEHITTDLVETNDRLDQEIQDRIDGDAQLHQEIVDEGNYREAYDEHLLGLINSKESKWMGEVPTYGHLPLTRYDWIPLTHFKCSTIYSISWGPDRFIAGSSDGHAWSSEDGRHWERRNVGTAFNGNVTATIYAEGTWLIGGDGGLLSRSVDGISWHNLGNSTTTSDIQDFAFGKGRFVYVTDGGVIATSEDEGFSWTKQDHTIRWGVHGVDSILSVTYCESLSGFVATTRRGMILISDTGSGWNLIDPNLNGSGAILTITSVEWEGKPTLIAGGDFPHKLITSTDGINWITAPRNYFKDAFPTDLKTCESGDGENYVIASLSDGRVAWAWDGVASAWTIEATGAKDRLLAIEHAPKNANIAFNGGLYVTGGNFGQAYARMPGKGLEPGDTWVVLNEDKDDLGPGLYTWSSLGWVTSCGEGSGGAINGIQKLTSDDGSVSFTPATGLPDPGGTIDLSVNGGVGGAHLGTTPPTDPGEGDLWIREPQNKLYFWDGTFWVEITTSGGSSTGGGSFLGEDPPAAPGKGDLWVREPELNLYVWTGDEWVQTNAVGGGGGSTGGGGSFGQAFPSSPQAGDRHVDENSLKDYVYTGDEWIQVGSVGGGGSSAEGLPSFGTDLPSDPEPGQRHVLEPELIDYVWTGDEWIQMNGVPGAKRNVGMLDELQV